MRALMAFCAVASATCMSASVAGRVASRLADFTSSVRVLPSGSNVLCARLVNDASTARWLMQAVDCRHAAALHLAIPETLLGACTDAPTAGAPAVMGVPAGRSVRTGRCQRAPRTPARTCRHVKPTPQPPPATAMSSSSVHAGLLQLQRVAALTTCGRLQLTGGLFRAYAAAAAQAAAVHAVQRDACTPTAPASSAVALQLQQRQLQWQQVAGLSLGEAQQLIARCGGLIRACLLSAPAGAAGFHASRLERNMDVLRAHGFTAAVGPELRGLMALAQPALVQEALRCHALQQQQQQQQHASQRSLPPSRRQLAACLVAVLEHAGQRRAAPPPHHSVQLLVEQLEYWEQQRRRWGSAHCWQPQAQAQRQSADLRQRPSQQREDASAGRQRAAAASPAAEQQQQLAALVLQHLGLPADHCVTATVVPKALLAVLQPVADGSCRRSHGGSGNASTDDGADRARSSSNESVSRTPPAAGSRGSYSCVEALSAALAQVARTRARMSARQLSACQARHVLLQLQQWPDLGRDAVVELLLKRPVLLCQAHPQHPPGALLQQLRQQLPELRGDALRGIIMGAPQLLARGPQHVQDVMQLLTGRLQLSVQLASAIVEQHPKLLAQAPQATSLNLGFLVGLGLSPGQVRHMLVRRPDWCTRPLADLTAQWQFIQQALKASLADLVAFPDLLSLPISTRMGPRILYARKRHLKLVLPSHAALLPQLSYERWAADKVVRLDRWLTVPDKALCAAVHLDPDDYARFKMAWRHVDGGS